LVGDVITEVIEFSGRIRWTISGRVILPVTHAAAVARFEARKYLIAGNQPVRILFGIGEASGNFDVEPAVSRTVKFFEELQPGAYYGCSISKPAARQLALDLFAVIVIKLQTDRHVCDLPSQKA
jgi:hypothetical protein